MSAVICKCSIERIAATISVLMIASSTTFAQFHDASDDLGFAGDGKAAFADADSDGWIDLYAGGRLLLNQQGLGFGVAENANLPSGEGIWGDFDNDGDPDLFIYSGAGSLHRNKGDGSFERIDFPELVTKSSRGAVWADLNNDGYLDLYVGGYEVWQEAVHPDAIFLNQRDGTFSEHWVSPDDRHYSARGVTSADFDEDGDVDIYTSHYRLQPNFLLRNDGSATLTDTAVEFGAAGIPDVVIEYTGGIRYPICGHTIGSAFGDLDNDGHLDLFVGNFSHPPANQNRPQFLHNQGPEGEFRFADRSADAGMAWQESYASPALADYDNDGDLDLYCTTVYATGSGGIKNYPALYRNDGEFRFTDVTEEEGIAQLGPTYQAAWADIDNDGDLDLCSNGKLFRNNAHGNHWISLDVRGNGQTVNRSAVGAIVRIKIGERVLTRHVETGTGEGNQNQLAIHFGLGTYSEALSVEVTYPGGYTHRFDGISIDTKHVLAMPEN